MDILRKLFPISFRYAGSVADLIVGILIYLIGGAIAGALIVFLSGLPVIGIICGLLGSLVDIYALAGIIIEILAFVKVL